MASALLESIVLDVYPTPSGRTPFNIFINGLNNISPGNLRLLFLPISTDTTETVSGGRTFTWDGDISGRITAQGNGVIVEFNGTSNSAQTPDTANLSFGNGTTDSPFSGVALVRPDNTGATKTVFAKGSPSGATGEYTLQVTSSEIWLLRVVDQSAGVTANRASNAAISTTALSLLGFSYAGTGGATAMNGMTLYVNGATFASTANNNASYVAMEDTTANYRVGEEVGTRWFAGDMGFQAIWAANLNATQQAAVAHLTRQYYGVAL